MPDSHEEPQDEEPATASPTSSPKASPGAKPGSRSEKLRAWKEKKLEEAKVKAEQAKVGLTKAAKEALQDDAEPDQTAMIEQLYASGEVSAAERDAMLETARKQLQFDDGAEFTELHSQKELTAKGKALPQAVAQHRLGKGMGRSQPFDSCRQKRGRGKAGA